MRRINVITTKLTLQNATTTRITNEFQ